MIKIDRDGLILCKIQGEIFEESLTKCKESSQIFIRRFMLSKIVKEFDSKSFLDGSLSNDEIFKSLEEEFGLSSYGSIKYNKEVLFWIGYLYRYMSYTYSLSSRQIYRMIKPKELNEVYLGYHSLDCAAAIERILEAKNISFDVDKLNESLFKLLRKHKYKDGIDILINKTVNKKRINNFTLDVYFNNKEVGKLSLDKNKNNEIKYKIHDNRFDNNEFKEVLIDKSRELLSKKLHIDTSLFTLVS